MTTIKWGDQTVPVDSIPEHVRAIYLQRALNHVYGNEGSAAVKDVPDADKATELELWREAKLAAIMSGDITMRAGGTRGDAVGAEMRRLARIAVSAALKKTGTKQKDADVPKLVSDYVAKYAETLRPIAQRNVDTAELPDA